MTDAWPLCPRGCDLICLGGGLDNSVVCKSLPVTVSEATGETSDSGYCSQVLWMKEARIREGKVFAWGHTASHQAGTCHWLTLG